MNLLTDTFLRAPGRPAEEELVARCGRLHEPVTRKRNEIDHRNPKKRDTIDSAKQTYYIRVDIGAEDGSASLEELEQIDARKKAEGQVRKRDEFRSSI